MKQPKRGLEVIAGSMFSGKTEELIRRLRRARIARQQTVVFSPATDTRSQKGHLQSHNGITIPSITITVPQQVLEYISSVQVIAFDEAQFFEEKLSEPFIRLCLQLSKERRVIVAGLCVTREGKPFDPVASLMVHATDLFRPKAICNICGDDAIYHQLKLHARTTAYVGAKQYEARCANCFDPPKE